jgi:hypothetical protein
MNLYITHRANVRLLLRYCILEIHATGSGTAMQRAGKDRRRCVGPMVSSLPLSAAMRFWKALNVDSYGTNAAASSDT